MRVFDITPGNKGLIAFEINASLGRRRATRVVASIAGVRILRSPRLLAREEVFCEFELKGQRFNVWEPFGGSSRYWIGSSNAAAASVLQVVRQAFVDYTLPKSPWLALWTRQGKGTL
jgi:hypothetical protein